MESLPKHGQGGTNGAGRRASVLVSVANGILRVRKYSKNPFMTEFGFEVPRKPSTIIQAFCGKTHTHTQPHDMV